MHGGAADGGPLRVPLNAGGSKAQLDALAAIIAAAPSEAPSDTSLGEVERLVIRYATQMTLDVKVTDTLFAAMRQHFDETQIVELTTAIAAYNMVSRILVALAIEPEV